MQLLSVNVAIKQVINAKSGATGIYKNPTDDPVTITHEGLSGDTIVDVKHHGGVDQAVYVYGCVDYAWWEAELNRTLPPGIFGDNLTISDLESASLCIGDRLQVGQVTLEVTAPRIPCETLAARMEDPKFVKHFAQAKRFGAYCRVIVGGDVKAGDAVTLTQYQGDRISINEVAQAYFSNAKITDDEIRRLLAVPIDIRSRNHYEEKLAKKTNVGK